MTESPEPVIYAYSVKIECTAKGLAMPTVHVYHNDATEASLQAVQLYNTTLARLKEAHLPTAVELTSLEAKT
jgi:hypothetical protein